MEWGAVDSSGLEHITYQSSENGILGRSGF